MYTIRLAAPERVRSGSMPKVYLALSLRSPTTGVQVKVPSGFSSPRTSAKDCMVLSSGAFSGVPVQMLTYRWPLYSTISQMEPP